MDKNKYQYYDVIVIGSGLAGSEAAIASSGYGNKTLLVNISSDNPSVLKQSSRFGGVSSESLMKNNEIFGGFFNNAVYENTIAQINEKESNITAVSRIVDKRKFTLFYKCYLENQSNLDTRQGLVTDIEIYGKDGNEKHKVTFSDGSIFFSHIAIISVGTFLNGKVIWGKNELEAGRHGEINSKRFCDSLKTFGYYFEKEKIFVGPGIDNRTIDFRKIKKIKSREKIYSDLANKPKWENNFKENILWKKYYSFKPKALKSEVARQIDEIIKSYKKANYEKLIDGEWCKLNLESRNQPEFEIELYPEGDITSELYLNKFGLAFSEEEQRLILNKFYGLENALIIRPGYFIEYDVLKKGQLKQSKESQIHKNIFFAGEVNGSMEYENAAMQGVIAGTAASINLLEKKHSLSKDDCSYILKFMEQILAGSKIHVNASKNLKEIIWEKLKT